MGERALKLMVVLLSTINAAVWFYYTESTMMAIAWAGVAIGFVIWIADDVRRR
jgi:membrane protein YdbS with pleckstrin-like domain